MRWLWRRSSHTINPQRGRLKKAVGMQAPNENTAICCSVVCLHVGGILRQDSTGLSGVTWGWEEDHERVLQSSLSLGMGSGQAPGLVKATTTRWEPLVTSPTPVGKWVGHGSSCAASWLQWFTRTGTFISINFRQCSGEQQSWLLELVPLLNRGLSMDKCLLRWLEHTKISLMRIY